jgi:hypothetical protein
MKRLINIFFDAACRTSRAEYEHPDILNMDIFALFGIFVSSSLSHVISTLSSLS